LGPDNEVLAPSYNCGSEIDALLSSGASVVLYRIDRSSSVDLNYLEKRITNRTKAVYVTHFFGFPQSTMEIKEICVRRGLHLIEDCALALFSNSGREILGTTGDISIFSLPKTLPVPDGGILLVNNSNLLGRPLNFSHPGHVKILIAALPGLKSGFLRWLSVRTPLYPLCKSLFERNHVGSIHSNVEDSLFKPDIPTSYYYDEKLSEKKISFLTKHMLKSFNTEHVIARRRKNFSTLLALLSQCGNVELLFKQLPNGVCPLSFPIIFENRDQMRSRLSERGIDAGAWWKGYHRSLPWNDFPDACFLKDHVLTLPVHQDLDERAVDYIAKTVGEVLKLL
jgi:dTDP-4-amino-4,6-dideoxygalactose transaminase